jgi:hypothetical protein
MLSPQPRRSTRAQRLGRAAAGAVLAGLALLLACVSDREVPVHGWWKDRGPIVRHDSFPENCSLCHKGQSWTELVEDFEFDHEGETGQALLGAHARAKCLRCHNDRGPVQLFARRGCAGCHEDVHRGQIGADCARCHGEENWSPEGQIAEHRRTRFPLTGAHAAAPCWRCHVNAQSGEFSQLDVRCVSCHRAELALAQDPDHAALFWTQDCERCHLPTTWGGAGFRHDVFAFGCVTCHLEDYQSALDPPHTRDSFPSACQLCHLNESWRPAEFDHPWPRLLIHEFFFCVECHQRPGNFTYYSCTHCHWHGRSNSAQHHEGVRGYVWENTQCVACHPDGE